MLQLISSAALLLIALGYISRRNQRRHILMMSAAFAIDISLLLFIELSRDATASVLKASSGLIWFHVTVSAFMLVLYFVQIVLGLRLLAGGARLRGTHRRIGWAFIAARLTNYGTGFFVADHLSK
jgi:uncharacterized membrane protein YozB (DUF420 family)